ncbi:hypothetical protein QZH41_007229 [Actinostola sp. cb2023]|nr:hypothetical protein QZH41_007229 [Actinostola sp. cb2023]
MAAKTTLKDNCDDLFDKIPYFDIKLLSQIEGEEIKQDAGRFLNVTDSDVDKLIEGEENKNTKKKTHYDLKLVKKSLEEERREDREIEKIPPHELNVYLSQFIVAARTKTGEEYEPTSLRGILSSVERHLSRANYGKSIFKDCEFQKARDALKAQTKGIEAAWAWKQTESYHSSFSCGN